MKKVILLVSFMPCMAYSQIIESFESGAADNWIQSVEGHWKADTSGTISGNYSLHHVFDNPAGGSDCIGVSLKDLHPSEGLTRWTFSIRHGCDPSGSNNWALYLLTDNSPVSFDDGNISNGFAIGVNLTGYDDTLRLWKIMNGTVSVVVTCPVNWQNDIGVNEAAGVIVERAESGHWNISVKDSQNSQAGDAEGMDRELFNSSWLVLNYRYTSTRDRLLWFDDLKVEGVFYEDKDPPEIISCKASGLQSVEITFTETPSEDILDPENYYLNNIDNRAIDVKRITATRYRIGFGKNFNNKEINNLLIKLCCDISGNCSGNLQVQFTPVWAEAGDVVITEIMADPLPAVSLPAREYLEIFNRTGFPYNLEKWKLSADDQTSFFPSIEIDPGEYMILCSASDTSLFSVFSRSIGLKPFPVMTDDGRMIVICDSSGNLIAGVEYSSDWYGNNLKRGGGWSLEMIDSKFPFYFEGNWEASSSRKGGTPGDINSSSRSNPDKIFTGIRNVFPDDSVSIALEFDEPVLNLPGRIGNIILGENRIVAVSIPDPLFRRFTLTPDRALSEGKVYTLSVSDNITDFAGNPASGEDFRFGITESAEKGDVVFNELLFNPLPDDPDYIELFNLSEKVIDASDLYLVSINDETGDTSEARQVSGERRCIVPGSFYAITADRAKVIRRYNYSVGEYIFNAVSLPSMADDRGHLMLLNRQMDLIDEVLYIDKMHYPLLAGNEGVSLEKIRPGLPSDESMNWHSASESSGWGTPGAENSAYGREVSGTGEVILSSPKISPDNDSFEDILVVDLNTEDTGNTISMTVFDETGGYVRKVAENYFAGSKASLIWDGTADDGSLVNTGIYIILIELYNNKGRTKGWKKVCAVIR